MTQAAALHSLLENSVDYAGLFPPCSLDLGAAMKNQAVYCRSAESWMLSSFVLPVARFEEAAKHLGHFDQRYPLRVSALGSQEQDTAKFRSTLSWVVKEILRFEAANSGLVKVEQLEMALPKQNVDAGLMEFIAAEVDTLAIKTFWEAPAASAQKTVELLQGRSESGRKLGFKLRTGGVTVDAFPSAADIADALVAAISAEVPIKFTAGLHHPVRQFRDEVGTKMHGFLNVLGAGVLAAEHGWDAQQCGAMLDSEDAQEFRFDQDSFGWREWSVTSEQIQQHRKLITSFGSCSFDDPREDLGLLGFL